MQMRVRVSDGRVEEIAKLKEIRMVSVSLEPVMNFRPEMCG